MSHNKIAIIGVDFGEIEAQLISHMVSINSKLRNIELFEIIIKTPERLVPEIFKLSNALFEIPKEVFIEKRKRKHWVKSKFYHERNRF
ncbi:MAG TPA: hypothetical protein VI815_02560 [Candidatus Nanoarchaeia archaeon]|nr:hypothetical protein [Candidatus Nanoarchaeia archaeon]